MFTKIIYHEFFGIPLFVYGGILALFCLLLTIFFALRIKKGKRVLFKWHHRLAFAALILAVIHGILGLFSGDIIKLSMTDFRQAKGQYQSYQIKTGAKIFNDNCVRCHPNGSNLIIPVLPTFLSEDHH